MTRVKFRYNTAVAVAGFIACCGALPLATVNAYLLLVVLIPFAVGCWGLRAGTDVDTQGVSVRALLGTRLVPWQAITGFVPQERRVLMTLRDGSAVRLPALVPADLPKLLTAVSAAAAEPSSDRPDRAADPQPVR